MFSSKPFFGIASIEACAVLLMGCIGISRGYCPKGWIENDRKCHGAFMPDGKYRKASEMVKANCIPFGGTSMLPTTTEQNRIGANLLSTRTPLYCTRAIIGLNDRYIEGNFRWGDGTELTWQNWQQYSTGEGVSSTERDCVSILEGGEWQVISCDDEPEYNYVTLCEQRMKDKCPSGWTKHGRRCYAGFPATGHEQSVEHMEQIYCIPNNGFLMNPRSEEEHRIALQLMRSAPSTFRGRAIIGLNDRHSEGSYKWSDGTPLTWSNWYPGQPDNRFSTGEDCVQLGGDGKWDDIRCSDVILRRYIILCEIPEGSGLCFSQYGTKCYFASPPAFGLDDVNDMESSICKLFGGRLMNPKTEAENNIAMSLVIKILATGKYSGLFGVGHEGSESSFRWSDGTYMGDILETGQRDNMPSYILSKGDAECIAMGSNGRWERPRCEQDNFYGFITLCEKPAKEKANKKEESPTLFSDKPNANSGSQTLFSDKPKKQEESPTLFSDKPNKNSGRLTLFSVARKQSEGLWVVGSPVLETKVHSITFCSRMCEKNPNCDTMNYNPSTGACIGYTNDGNLEYSNNPDWEIWTFVNTLY